MALAVTTDFEVRTTGSDPNGGGFDIASTGTDYSQQNSAQVAYTDLVVDPTTNTNCTSVITPFTSLHVGNIINITGGTGFTVQRVQIVSVAAGIATCDKSLGTLSSIGGTGNLGGAMATTLAANTARASGNVIHVKSGTYTSAGLSLGTANATARQSAIVGFGSTRRDGGTKPVFTPNANSVTMFTMGSTNNLFENLTLDAGVRTSCTAVANTNNGGHLFYKCLIKAFATTFSNNNSTISVDSCEFTANTGSMTLATTANFILKNNEYHDNTATPVIIGSNSLNPSIIKRCLFHNNSGASTDGVSQTGGTLEMSECIFYHNGRDGFRNTAGVGIRSVVDNCIAVNNGGWGFNGNSATMSSNQFLRNCAAYNNTSGDKQNFDANYTVNFQSLSADPFVAASNTASTNQNFGLNNTAGGGAVLRALGFPTTWSFSTNTVNYQDSGVAQHQDTGGGGAVTTASTFAV